MERITGGYTLQAAPQVPFAPTIGILFSRIGLKLDDTDYVVKVDYDPELGYPRSMEMHPSGNPKAAGLSVSVVSLSPLGTIE